MTTDPLVSLVADLAREHAEPLPGDLPACWPVLVELGLPGIGIAEASGGAGGSLGDLVTVVQALARHAIGTPIVEHAVAAWALAEAGHDPVSGLHTVTTALPGPVRWARHAEAVVVVGDDVGVVPVRPGSLRCGLSIAGEPFDEVTGDCDELGGRVLAAAVRARLGRLRAAALTGAAQGAYELTRAHVIRREQFGQPLIRIPAVATNLARMKTALIQAEVSLTRGADADLYAAAVARVLAGRAATDVARLAHQLHGGLGITLEHPLHRFTRRLWAWRDADLHQRSWAMLLARTALAKGEIAVWEQLTS